MRGALGTTGRYDPNHWTGLDEMTCQVVYVDALGKETAIELKTQMFT